MPAPLAHDDTAAAVAVLTLDTETVPVDVAWALLARHRDGGFALAAALVDDLGPGPVLAGIAELLGDIDFVDLTAPTLRYRRDTELLGRCDPTRLLTLAAVPLADPDNPDIPVVVAANPVDPALADYLSAVFADRFRVVLGTRAQIQDALALSVDPADAAAQLEANPRAVLQWTDRLLARAAAERASDLHLQYERNGRLRVRLRTDGTLRLGPPAPPDLSAEIVGALMNKAGMDVSNLLLPQDGTFTFSAAGRSIDARASMIPQDTGPSLVIRLLDTAATRLDIDDLGASPQVIARLRRAVRRAHGTIITSGPTGSGKTTTMWALLRELDADTLNIVTVEDPIEYRLPGVGQTQIRSGLGERSLTFARALRAFLRHDPDVILVGEVRDTETALVASEAAITGHLVLTTVHTPDAPSVFSRMVQMGVPRHMVAEALTTVCSQRLLRRLHACAVTDTPTAEEAAAITAWGLPVPAQVRRPVGCEVCRGTGYLGRLVVIELIEPNETFRRAVLANEPVDVLARLARDCGYVTLLEDALRHVADGATSLDEVYRVVVTDLDDDTAPDPNAAADAGAGVGGAAAVDGDGER